MVSLFLFDLLLLYDRITLTVFFNFTLVAAHKIPFSPLLQVREQVTNLCISVLLSYRKFCATVTSSGQLILPEALKLLPLYTLGTFLSANMFMPSYRNVLSLSCHILVKLCTTNIFVL
jgi:hypothetical protein